MLYQIMQLNVIFSPTRTDDRFYYQAVFIRGLADL